MNEEEAEKCIKISQAYLKENNSEKALRFAQKAYRMHPTEHTKQWLDQVQHEHAPKYTSEQLDAVREFEQRVGSNKHDLYLILNVGKGASESELKRAYRNYALRFHPDKNRAPGAEECFKLVSKAFSILSDQTKRRHYDLGEQEPAASSSEYNSYANPFARDSFRPSRRQTRAFDFTFNNQSAFDAEDLFRTFFAGTNPFQQQQQAFYQRERDSFHFNPITNPVGYITERILTSLRSRFNFLNNWYLKTLLPLVMVVAFSAISNWYTNKSNAQAASNFVHNRIVFEPSNSFPFEHPLVFSKDVQISYWANHQFENTLFATGWRGHKRPKDGDTFKRYFEPAIKTEYIQYLQVQCKKERADVQRRLRHAIATNNQQLITEIGNERQRHCELLYQLG